MTKYLTFAEVRTVINKFNRDEISFSKVVELLNEKVSEKIPSKLIEDGTPCHNCQGSGCEVCNGYGYYT
jgi:hypothetical protein